MLNCAQYEQNQVSSCRHEHSKAKAWNDCAGFLFMKGGCHTEEIRNLEGKRVCDISLDRTVIEIVQKGCLTRITANPDGTLNVENIRLTQVA